MTACQHSWCDLKIGDNGGKVKHVRRQWVVLGCGATVMPAAALKCNAQGPNHAAIVEQDA
ncbi:MAG: hypothetical protein R2932_46180 [Caldilineaceae bacterium]